MRAIRIHRFGGPEVLQFDDLPLPGPEACEVRIKVTTIGLNRTEVSLRKGHSVYSVSLPTRIGAEAVGIIDAIGAGVKKFKPGDRVGTLISLAGPNYFGAYAEYVVVPELAVFATPVGVSDKEAAATWMAYLTAWGGLALAGGLKEGQSVVIPAASSSVGIAAIQIARDFGARAIASTTHTNKVDPLRQLGADAVIDMTREDFVVRVKELTDGRGADLFFDPVVGGLIDREIAAAAVDAHILPYGLLNVKSTSIDPAQLLSKRLRITGYRVGMITGVPGALDRAVAYVSQGISDGRLRPVIAATFDFEDAAEAHRFMESNQQIGKILLVL